MSVVQAETILGPSIRLHGEISGSGPMVLHGQFAGTITLAEGELMIGREARVEATLRAVAVDIRGAVIGDIFAPERMAVRASGDVRGALHTGRLTVEDGASIHGKVNSDVDKAAQTSAGN